jgi:endonuclease YncB( thermonuclease family)
MGYRLVKGAFVAVGGQPDGDSIRFRPDNPDLLKGFPQGDARVSAGGAAKGTAQLRMEGVDTLELHYTTPADHQEIVAARRARDLLLSDLLGFESVQFDASATVTSTVPSMISGYILTNGLDNARNRRPIAFLFTGPSGRADGSNVFVTGDMLAESVNAGLLEAGEAYPLFYNNLPAVLRDVLAGLAARARADDKGLWPADRSLTGIKATSKDALKKYVFFPKLYRRLKDYFVETRATSLTGFDAWIRARPVDRDDAVWIGPLRELGNLHNVYRVSGGRIKMLYRSEELVFQSQGALVRPAAPVATPRPRVPRAPRGAWQADAMG